MARGHAKRKNGAQAARLFAEAYAKSPKLLEGDRGAVVAVYEAKDYELAGAHLSRAEIVALRSLLDVARAGDGVTIRARGDAALDDDALRAAGLSKREVLELADKLEDRATPDFELDLSRMKSPEEMAAKMEEAVPKLDLD